MAKILSGPVWVNKFPNSTAIGDLVDPFQSNVTNFINALKAANATVTVSATKRPKERAFLMHWSYRVAKENFDPAEVQAMAGVDIDWVHRDLRGTKDLKASKNAAQQMVNLYEIAYRPAMVSRHSEGKAIDMDIFWAASELKIKDGTGKSVVIKGGFRNGNNPDLHIVGKSYKVIKLVSDPPHWSSDGH